MNFNDSTYNFLGRSLDTNRTRLLRTGAAALCHECKSVQNLTDYFPNREILLACGHRRSLLTDPKVAVDYETEKAIRGKRIPGSNMKATITSVEDAA
jgi:hypothetical protein